MIGTAYHHALGKRLANAQGGEGGLHIPRGADGTCGTHGRRRAGPPQVRDELGRASRNAHHRSEVGSRVGSFDRLELQLHVIDCTKEVEGWHVQRPAMAATDEGPGGMHDKLLSNVLAQAEALMVGRKNPPRAPRTFDGDRPSGLILLPRLDPHSLGALITLYEHKTFVEGVVWGINSFDQWGVELGKEMANAILEDLVGRGSKPHDPSTAALINRLKN